MKTIKTKAVSATTTKPMKIMYQITLKTIAV